MLDTEKCGKYNSCTPVPYLNLNLKVLTLQKLMKVYTSLHNGVYALLHCKNEVGIP